MKKTIKLVSSLTLSVILLTGSSIAFADTQSSTNFYSKKNDKIIEINTEKMANITDKKEIKRLTNLGFTEDEIKNFSISEYNKFKGLNGKTLSKNTKYYRITKGVGAKEITYEQSTKEILQSNIKRSMISAQSNGSDTEQTSSWLTMTTTVSDQGNKNYIFKNSFKWLTDPYCTFEDVIGLTHNSNISVNQNSEYLKYTYDRYSKTIPSMYLGTDSVYYWTADKKNNSGYAFKFDILGEVTVNQTTVNWVRNNSGYLIYTGTASPSNYIGNSNAYGHYAHQQMSISPSIDLVSGNMSVSPSMAFDEATDTDVQFYID